MDDSIGIFRVIAEDTSKEILGTAFAIKTFEYDKKYYLLTAYHVISELEAKGRSIIIKDENDNFFSAMKVFPKKLSMEYREFGQDYALLEMYSEVKYKTFEMAIINKRLECFVRGAIPHYSTIYTSFDGKILGEESISNQKKVLQISLDTKLIFDAQNKLIPEQEVLCGLSGAPVLVELNGETVCVGVLGNLERDCRGSVKYAVPIKTIVEDCLKQLHITYRLLNEKAEDNISFQEEALIELAIGDTEEFLFSEEKLEQTAWNKLSNLFYKGFPVDSLLHSIIESKSYQTYNAEVKCAILYFYARLLFKCSKNMLAFDAFHNISKMLCAVSYSTRIKLETLISSRSAIEKRIELPDETLSAIRYAGDKIVNLPGASDEYVSNELASLYGRGLTNLFSIHIDYSCQEKEELSKIYLEHKYLLEKNPIKLCKQDVVNTSLQWYLGYWGVSKEFDLQSLSVAVYNGFIQSKNRKNSIFYIQSMISYGLFCALNEQKVQAVKILLLSAKLMHKEKVRLSHEGVKQLLLILREKYISLYMIFEIAYKTQMDEYFFDKVSICQVDLGVRTWESISTQVNELYMFKYNHNKIYNVGMEEIKIFL